MIKKTILIDLDGVLNNYKGDFDRNFIPNIKEGAKEFLKEVTKKYTIKIFTTRNRIITVVPCPEEFAFEGMNLVAQSASVLCLFSILKNEKNLCFKSYCKKAYKSILKETSMR